MLDCILRVFVQSVSRHTVEEYLFSSREYKALISRSSFLALGACVWAVLA